MNFFETECKEGSDELSKKKRKRNAEYQRDCRSRKRQLKPNKTPAPGFEPEHDPNGKPAAGRKERGWCFTLNNYTPQHETDLQKLEAQYLVYGHEVGENGTPHLQGFVFFENRRTFASVRALFPWHIEGKKKQSTFSQAINYCKKEDQGFFQKGVAPLDPKDKGLVEKERWEVTRNLAVGNKIGDIEAEHYVKYYSTLRRIRDDNKEKPTDLEEVCGIWLYGESGAGKTQYAKTEYPHHFVKDCNSWWDQYEDEDVIVIEDVDKTQTGMARNLKIWADSRPFKAQVKGSYVFIRPKKMIVTSQYTIEEIWDDEKTRDALNRRFKKIHFIKQLGPPRDAQKGTNGPPKDAQKGTECPPKDAQNSPLKDAQE